MWFSRFIRLWLLPLLFATVFLAPASHAQNQQAYVLLNPPRASDTPGKIEVLEFFAYNCPHCAVIEPLVSAWKKTLPEDVVLKKVPVSFNANMQVLQQLYYTLQALDRLDLHNKVFSAIHGERQRLYDKKSISDWAVAQGLARAKFDVVFDSFSVRTKTQRANQLADAYAIEGIPSFAVGGKFLTSPAMTGNSYESALQEVTRLISKARD
jgi:thiol:disulfide interchange protein DsbA